ncbi:hypothetical protein [Kitasatospora sp. NPDC088346]|uniref:hypothetical protein n=1 Tax=Kitasatospora sp. NPDC088346 TaxID=3364073 RepID=UPI00380EC4BD
MATTHLRACDVPELRHELARWADENVRRAERGTGAVLTHGFTDPRLVRSAVRGAELYFVNDDITWLARRTGEGLPVCAFDDDDLPDPMGLLLWSDDPSAHTTTLGRPRAVLWSRVTTTLRVLVLDDAGPYRRTLQEAGRQVDPGWAHQVTSTLAGDLAVAFGAAVPLGVETDWDQVRRAWSTDRNGHPVQDRYGQGNSTLSSITDDQLRVLRTLLATLLLIRQPADERRGLWQSEDVRPDTAARKRLRQAGAEHPDAPVRYITLRQSARPAAGTTTAARTPRAASTGTAGSSNRTAAPTPTGTTRRAGHAAGSAPTSPHRPAARTRRSSAPRESTSCAAEHRWPRRRPHARSGRPGADLPDGHDGHPGSAFARFDPRCGPRSTWHVVWIRDCGRTAVRR